MHKFSMGLPLIVGIALLGSACAPKAVACTDPLGCVSVSSGESIRIASLLTMSGPDGVYGVDAVRGVEIAVADKKTVAGHAIELVEEDDLCTEEGGQQGATKLAADHQLVGVIGTTCSSGTVPAATILTNVHVPLISPSSTAPSLTDPATHQVGFLRSIYNDKAQGKAVAEFAFTILGTRRMVTFHDGTAYPQQLQQAACEDFEQLGGDCILQFDISSGEDILTVLQNVSGEDPDVIYFPLYTDNGVALMKAVLGAGISDPALISSDGLLSRDFIEKGGAGTEGMYLSGPSEVQESSDFTEKYNARYGEAPIASYHLQGYDAAMMLLNALDKVAVRGASGSVFIPRRALLDALYATRGMQGLSGSLTCSPTGDCAKPDIDIFQVVDGTFKVIFP